MELGFSPGSIEFLKRHKFVRANANGFVTGHDFSRAEQAAQ
jgi:hypothetical protein